MFEPDSAEETVPGVVQGEGYVDVWGRDGELNTFYYCPTEILDIPVSDQQVFDMGYYDALAEFHASEQGNGKG